MAEVEKNEDYDIDFNRIKELISIYENKEKLGEFRKRYTEEDTKKDFILPLFEALGWNVSNKAKRNDSVSAEETISKKRVDYGFRINGIPKFFLEAKSLKEKNIQTNSVFIEQAINYSWMKSCSWAILTNFETLAVYNADWKTGNPGSNVFFVLHPKDFLNDYKFKLLSKKAFERNELDNLASQYGKKQLKNPINKQLLQDMIRFREILSKDIVRNNKDKNLTQDEIDESVQRILDRLIFIRNAEDRGLEENQLQSDVRQWYSKGKGQLIKEISDVYKDYDNKYNSKLFAHHLCDDLYIDNEALKEVIEGLNQAKDNSYKYDFSVIDSDVLGNIYEQYLGNILKSTPRRAKLEESKVHRKEQGIYYTPSYIVDYIVKNTVGEYIKTHSPEEIRNVRILDPACGSGSFLIKAYKELENYWYNYYSKNNKIRKGARNINQARFVDIDTENKTFEFYSIKTEILKNNIFGVDLDPKAVNIAQLNLLLQISERKQRLPILYNNIKVGNSLIDDPSISDRAFKWEEEFSDIMKGGGFDIIIGNPPYIKEYLNRAAFEPIKKTGLAKYYQGKMDIWYLFGSLSIDLLKESGLHSFIAQNNWVTSFGASKFRDKVLSETEIISFVDFNEFKVFQDSEIQTMIYVVRKKKPSISYKVHYYLVKDNNIPQSKLSCCLNNPALSCLEVEKKILDLKPSAFISKEINFVSSSINEVIAQIEERSNFHLQDKDISTGIDVHQDFVIRDHLDRLNNPSIKIGDGIFVINQNELDRLNLTENEREIIKPYFTSKDLTRYYGNTKNKYYIIYSKSNMNKVITQYPNIKKHLDKFKDIITSDFRPYGLHRARNQNFFEGEKIISLRKTIEPHFTYTDFPCYVSQTFFVIKPKNVNLKVLTAILNSDIMHFWLRNKGKKQGNLLQIDKPQLLALPIRLPENSLEETKINKKIIESMNLIIGTTKKLNESEREAQKDIFKTRINNETEKIKALVYKLYGLEENSITQIKNFLTKHLDMK